MEIPNKEQHLHLKIRENDVDSVKKLLDSGVDINCLFYGWTPLQLSINLCYEDIAILLINRGCDIYRHDRNNVSPLEDAINRNLCKVVGVLMSKGADVSVPLTSGEPAICFAACKDFCTMVSILAKDKKNIDIKNPKDETALFIACREGYTHTAQLLLEAGADADLICRGEEQQTPIIAAAANENKDVIKVLLKFGCNVNAQDSDGWTALWYAYSNSNHDIMHLLLRSGANKNVQNSEGKTILDEARFAEDEDLIDMLNKFSQSWT